MDDMLDLIIPTPEERAVEKFRFLLLETKSPTGVRFEQFAPHDPHQGLPDCRVGEECKTWRFNDQEALHLFAAARVRDLRRDGINATRAPRHRYEHCYDSRTRWNATYDSGTKIHLAW